MNIHFIQHETFEAPGAYLSWAETRGHTISFSKVYQYDSLPSSAENIDMLVVMGGPQSPDTTLSECPYFDSSAEIELIGLFVDAGKAIIGVCLGSQLVGEAFGARYGHSPEKEIGNFPIRLTKEGLQDHKISHFGEELTVGHWHNDMPGLTATCKILAASDGCPRQIVSYSELVYGFQCHMELTRDVVKLLIASDGELQQKSTQYDFVQHPDQIEQFPYSEMNSKLWTFLDKLAIEYLESK
jgi:GMP synthase (glutamine-hydrolysing)